MEKSSRDVMIRADERSPEKKAELTDTLKESILEGMRDVLGEGGMRAALFHLQLVQYASDPRTFHGNLHVVFKDGAIILEKIIVKELYRRLGLPFRAGTDFDFEEHVNLAKNILSSRISEGIAFD